jgi:SAM-dependent methyltransferase
MRRLLKHLLNDQYERLVRASCSEQQFTVPSAVQRYFNNAYAFEYVAAIRRLVGNAQRILIIGDAGGRDYFSLKLIGRRPLVMDVAEQSLVPDLVIADANDPLPFAAATFDAAVVAEVIEHLPDDFSALRRIRNVLKEGGALVLTVPYFHDEEPTHLRIHSPASIERLLRAAGWFVAEYVEKGGGLCSVAGWFPFAMAIHAANLIAFTLTGRTYYQPMNRRVADFDFWLGRKRHSWHRWSRYYGAFIKCAKAAPEDYVQMNVRAFQNLACGWCEREDRGLLKGCKHFDRQCPSGRGCSQEKTHHRDLGGHRVFSPCSLCPPW